MGSKAKHRNVVLESVDIIGAAKALPALTKASTSHYECEASNRLVSDVVKKYRKLASGTTDIQATLVSLEGIAAMLEMEVDQNLPNEMLGELGLEKVFVPKGTGLKSQNPGTTTTAANKKSR